MNNKNSFLIIINICHYLINNKVNFLKEDKYILEMTKLTFLEC